MNPTTAIAFDAGRLRERVAELGRDIDAAYAGQTVLLIGVLTSSVMFLADLARALTIRAEIDFLGISSYERDRRDAAPAPIRFTSDLARPIEGRHCIIVEDIIDTGMTLGYISAALRARRPASLAVATLLDRPQRRLVDLPIAFRGFTIDDDFVVGYGMDHRGRYRESPDLLVCKDWPRD